MKCECGRTIRNRKNGIKHEKCNRCRLGHLSPSKLNSVRNGKVKVGRLIFTCLCGETFSVLFSPRELCEEVCPRCKRLAFELKSNARLEEFSLKVMPWQSSAKAETGPHKNQRTSEATLEAQETTRKESSVDSD